MIEIEQVGSGDPMEFDVVVRVGAGESRHKVSLGSETVDRVAPGTEPAELVRASFEFLLEREPKEAILSRFDVTVIERYFPEYGEEIGKYLHGEC